MRRFSNKKVMYSRVVGKLVFLSANLGRGVMVPSLQIVLLKKFD